MYFKRNCPNVPLKLELPNLKEYMPEDKLEVAAEAEVEVKEAEVIDTEIVIPEEKREKISKLGFSGIETYLVTKEGVLSVIPEKGAEIDVKALSNAVRDYVPQKTDGEIVSEKPDVQITLNDIIKVLREKGIL